MNKRKIIVFAVGVLLMLMLALPWAALAEEGEGETLKLDVVRVGPASTTVASGASFGATFRVENNSTGVDKDRTFSGTASVATTGGIGCTPTSASFSALAEGSPLTISLSCTAPTGPATGTIIVSASGTPSPKTGGGVCGVGGNKCSDDGVPQKLTVNVNPPPDTTPPVIVPTVSPAPNANGWNNTDVTVSWSVSDPESGIASSSGCGTTTLTTETAGTPLTCSATNGAGLPNSASVTVKIDKTAPTASASASPGPNANGWNNTNVVVSFNGSDALSGIEGCSASVTLSSEGAGQSASGTCTDKAGNVSAPATASGINIDKTPPTFGACPTGGPFLLNSGLQSVGPIAVDAAISDLDAGLSMLSGLVDTSSIGTKTVTFTAVDNAGNSATKSCGYSVIYKWDGFFRPVDNLPVLNVAKAGSAIPVKFSLSGNQGLNIFASGTPVYPRSVVIACDSMAPADGIEETVTAGGSSLNYDASADQYIYVWKTDKAWAGTCRQLVVKLNDDTVHQANFKFSK